LSHVTVLYGIPVYGKSDSIFTIKVPLLKVHLYNEVVFNAYRYLVYKFSQYAFISKGIIIKNYDPSSGTVDVEIPLSAQLDVNKVESAIAELFEDFIEQYFIPRLVERIGEAKLEDLMMIFYRKRRKGEKETGLASVILPLGLVEQYLDSIESRSWAIQKRSIKSIQTRRNRIESRVEELVSKGVKEDDLVMLDKEGNVELFEINKIVEDLKRIKSNIVSSFRDEVKFVKGVNKCCYCRSPLNKLSFQVAGRLGVGRYRLPHETKTDLTGSARMCVGCLLVSMYYILEGGDRMLAYTFNGLLGVLRVEEKFSKSSTLDFAISLLDYLKKNIPVEWARTLVLNSAFGDEKAVIELENIDEVAIERLALLAHFPTQVLHDENVQRILLDYMRSNFSGFISHLVYILKHFPKQLEKGGVMSYVSKLITKYITPYLYRETELRVAYTVASIAESVIYLLKNSGEDQYTLRKFADTLSMGGLTSALAYALQRLKSPPKTITLSKYVDKPIVKEVLDEHGFSYYEENGDIHIYLNSVPQAEINIREKHGRRVFSKAYELLIIMAPEIVYKEEKEEESKGGGVVQS